MDHKEFEKILKEFVYVVLTNPELEVIEMKYGLKGKALSLKKTAETLRLSVSKVRDLERNGLIRLVGSPRIGSFVSKLSNVDLNKVRTETNMGLVMLAQQILVNA